MTSIDALRSGWALRTDRNETVTQRRLEESVR
jgi:hypothetical protein